jgi:hypothetical protein
MSISGKVFPLTHIHRIYMSGRRDQSGRKRRLCGEEENVEERGGREGCGVRGEETDKLRERARNGIRKSLPPLPYQVPPHERLRQVRRARSYYCYYFLNGLRRREGES